VAVPKGTRAMQMLSPTTGHRSFRRLVRPHLLPLPCWPVVEWGIAMLTQSQESWDRQRKTNSCPQVVARMSVRGMRFPDRRREEVALLLPRLPEMGVHLLQYQ
jgi:hypothetical protein